MLEFWFDFSSPYAYFASLEVDALAARHGRQAVWRPFLLGVAFKATGMGPLPQMPMRGDYAVRDWERIARLRGVSYALPEPFPFNSLQLCRAFYWLDAQDPGAAKALAQAALAAVFQQSIPLLTPESVAALASAQGHDHGAVLAALAAPEVKERCRQATDEALAKGVFGAPMLLVDGEPFWGWDRLPMAEQWLAQGGW